jgi:hypothetical protein
MESEMTAGFDGFDRVIELTRRIYQQQQDEWQKRIDATRYETAYELRQKANDEAINAVLEKL